MKFQLMNDQIMTHNTVSPQLDLPGFRFHPTEEELLDFYLKEMVLGINLRCIIRCLIVYQYHPQDLPDLCSIGEREWYFIVPRHTNQGPGGRPNRMTMNGFWKATGSDREIFSTREPTKVIGMRKTLVFYHGKAPKGSKTDWVMNEYRLPDEFKSSKEFVLCKIYRKATPLKALEERATANVTHIEQCAILSRPTGGERSRAEDRSGIVEFNRVQMVK